VLPTEVRQKVEELDIPNPASGRWTAEKMTMFGTLPDEEAARTVGRSPHALTQKRRQVASRRSASGGGWKPAREDAEAVRRNPRAMTRSDR
jgi:hypothetical protein